MRLQSKPITILVADDDADDRMLLQDAFLENGLPNDLRFVTDGEELLAYLRHDGAYATADSSPSPGIILLDLNMPRLDGREALRLIKADPRFQRIPVIVLTTSRAGEDILRTYDLGVSSFITKPVTFDGLIKIVQVLSAYWTGIVALPHADLTQV